MKSQLPRLAAILLKTSVAAAAVTAVAVLVMPAKARGAEPQEVTIDAAKRYQMIEGFGTSLRTWEEKYRSLYGGREFQRAYAEEAGCAMLRVSLDGSVPSEPIEDWREISHRDFDAPGPGSRTRLLTEFARGVRRFNPDLRVIGTVWSPPAWMKFNDAMTDERSAAIQGNDYKDVRNRVRPKYYRHFAQWVAEMAKLYRAEGVPLYAVSPGNEVMFTQKFESCVWSAEDYAKIVGMLGRTLEREGLEEVKVFGPETMTGHNWSLANPIYVKKLMGDPEAAEQLDLFATHGYPHGFEADPAGGNAKPFWKLIRRYERPYWITEGGTRGHDWPEPLTGIAAQIHNSLVRGGVSAFLAWQITDQEKSSAALMVMDRPTRKTNAAQHYFRLVRPGAVRIAAQPAYGRVMASAYRHPEAGTLTAVLINPGDQAQSVRLRFVRPPDFDRMALWRTSSEEGFKRLGHVPLRGSVLALEMPRRSMVSLQGSTRKGGAPAPEN